MYIICTCIKHNGNNGTLYTGLCFQSILLYNVKARLSQLFVFIEVPVPNQAISGHVYVCSGSCIYVC
jgi:hypothetical protein